MKESRLKGQFTGGTVAYGYKVVNRKIEIDEDKAEIVRKIFDMTDQGFTAPEIITYLHNNGFDHNGRPFLKNAIYWLLHNPKYIGKFMVNGEDYDNVYPPIIDVELFQRVQSHLEQNQLGRNCIYTDFLLRGKVYCGYCGHRINGESGTSHNGNKYFFYKCSWRKKGKGNCTKQTVRKDDLENIVLDMAMDLFTNKVDLDIIADEIMRVREESVKEHCELNILVAKQREAQKALDNVMKAVEAGVFTATTKNRMEELELEIDRLAVLIVKEENKLQQAISRDDVMEYLTNGVREQSPKVLMELLVHKVTLWDDHIEVEFNYSDKTNPDGPVTARRDLSISKTMYNMSVTNCAIIVRKRIAIDTLTLD